MVYHAGFGLPGGFVGVDVFFVISGYLITQGMLRELQSGQFSLQRFWERRVRRILPASLATIMTVLAAGYFCSPRVTTKNSPTDRSRSSSSAATSFMVRHRILCWPGGIKALASHLVAGCRRAILLWFADFSFASISRRSERGSGRPLRGCGRFLCSMRRFDAADAQRYLLSAAHSRLGTFGRKSNRLPGRAKCAKPASWTEQWVTASSLAGLIGAMLLIKAGTSFRSRLCRSHPPCDSPASSD